MMESACRSIHRMSRHSKRMRLPRSQDEMDSLLHVAGIPPMDVVGLRGRLNPRAQKCFDYVQGTNHYILTPPPKQLLCCTTFSRWFCCHKACSMSGGPKTTSSGLRELRLRIDGCFISANTNTAIAEHPCRHLADWLRAAINTAVCPPGQTPPTARLYDIRIWPIAPQLARPRARSRRPRGGHPQRERTPRRFCRPQDPQWRDLLAAQAGQGRRRPRCCHRTPQEARRPPGFQRARPWALRPRRVSARRLRRRLRCGRRRASRLPDLRGCHPRRLRPGQSEGRPRRQGPLDEDPRRPRPAHLVPR